ncbi:MAG: amidohydrolase family protein [Actinomycetaceae bacterium]
MRDGPGGVTVLHGPVVLGPDGGLDRVEAVVVSGGRIVAVGRPPAGLRAARHVDAAGLAITPGLVDAHAHLAWSSFIPDDDAPDEPGDLPAATREILRRTLARGVVRARDAGGLTARVRDAAATEGLGPEVDVAVDIIRGDEVAGPEEMRRRVRSTLAAGATWIKLLATHGVSVPGAVEDAVARGGPTEGGRPSETAGSVPTAGVERDASAVGPVDLDPLIDRATMAAAIEEATAGGARVMVHAWGGPALTDAIELGAASVEHGMFLTERDAAAAAAAGCWFVPTVTIYRDVAAMAEAGDLPPAIGVRARRAAAAHADAVAIARRAGVRIATGTDFSSMETHGKAVREIASLVRCGLTVAEAWRAATVAGHALLAGDATSVGSSAAVARSPMVGRTMPGGRSAPGSARQPASATGTDSPARDTPARDTPARGVIVPGARADLAAWSVDPTDPAALADGPEPRFVVVGGRLVEPQAPASST